MLTPDYTPVCVLRSGGDFKPEHVTRLGRMVPKLVCMTDMDVTGVPTLPLLEMWPGWWSKLEAFGPQIKGDVLLIDLDTLIIRMPPMPTETTVLRDFTRPQYMGSGFMYLTQNDRERCYSAFTGDPEGHMARCTTSEAWGDQGFLQPLIGDSQKWGMNIVSWKRHCKRGIPKDTDVVCFHGTPRPWDCGY